MALPSLPGVPPIPSQAAPPPVVAAPAPAAAAPTDPAAPAQPPGPDPGRRAFFRSFGRQAFTTAAQVVGMTQAVSQATTNVAVNLAGLAVDPQGTAQRLGVTPAPSAVGANPATPAAGTSATPGQLPAPARPATPAGPPAQHKSPYRLSGDVLYLLDQRGLPEKLDEQVCRRASDVAFYLRVMAVRGGPLMAQLSAYGLALTAKEFAPRAYHARQAEWKRCCRALVAARPGSRMIRFAIDRMSAIHDTFGPDADPVEVANRLRREADSLAMEAQLDHATIARHLAARLPNPDGRPLQLLVHGAPGTSTGGHIGTALNAIALLAQDERRIKVWITETRPYLEGARLATWELGPTGVETIVLPDLAVGYLLDHETVDAVLLGAEWIAANGDTSNVAGSRVVAEMAAVGRRGSVPVYVAAPITTYDPAMADGDALPGELRPARELTQHLAGWKPERPVGLVPALDVIPVGRITAFVTEGGFVEPDPAALGAALAARTARRTPVGPPFVAASDEPAAAADDHGDGYFDDSDDPGPILEPDPDEQTTLGGSTPA
ncbi:MAG: hypothetical protein U0869_01645 [Chloroflexota bacterium]